MPTPFATRACLFGGALFAAGVAHAEPDAFVLGFQSGGIADGSSYFGTIMGTSILGIGTTAYGFGDFFALIRSENDELLLRHERDSLDTFSYTFVFLVVDFYALEDGAGVAAWDLGDWGFTDAFIHDITDNVTLLNAGGLPPGQEELQFEEGHSYRYSCVVSGVDPGGDAFFRLAPVGSCEADLDGNGLLNVDDIETFVAGFLGGCP